MAPFARRGVLVLLAVGSTAACDANPAAGETPAPSAAPIVYRAQTPVDERAFDTRVQAGLSLLEEAVANDDAELAEIQLQRLRALDTGPQVLEMLEKYERLLEGRRIGRSIHLGLVAESAGEASGRYRLLATLRHDEPEPLHFVFHPLELRQVTTTVHLVSVPNRAAATGEALEALEQRAAGRRALDLLGDLTVEPGELRVIDLGLQPPPDPRALAARTTWRLTSRSGLVERGGESFPVQSLPTVVCERTRRAPWLPAASVAPAEWLRYALGPNPELAALMERAVRVDPGEREAALDLLTAELDEVPELRLQALVPAVRWLARTADPGGEGEAWGTWLRLREQHLSQLPDAEPSNPDAAPAVRAAGEARAIELGSGVSASAPTLAPEDAPSGLDLPEPR